MDCSLSFVLHGVWKLDPDLCYVFSGKCFLHDLNGYCAVFSMQIAVSHAVNRRENLLGETSSVSTIELT